MDEITESVLKMFAAEHWQRDGHRIQRWGSSTGHLVRNVALSDGDDTAEVIIRALTAQKSKVTPLCGLVATTTMGSAPYQPK